MYEARYSYWGSLSANTILHVHAGLSRVCSAQQCVFLLSSYTHAVLMVGGKASSYDTL